MRDTCDEALFPRVKRVLSRVQEKIAQGGGGNSHGNSTDVSRQAEEPYCHFHSVPLKKYTKDGRAWYSHYDAAIKAWCRGK